MDLEKEYENMKFLKAKIRDEGFHYCFKHYSNWDEIEDEEFTKLKKYYLQFSKHLEDHIEKYYNELEDKLEERGLL